MNIDPAVINQVLSAIPYPVGKANLIQLAKQHGANDQIVGVLNALPDKTFNSPQEIQDLIAGGSMGQLGKLGGLFNR